jgi:hypothetical protein
MATPWECEALYLKTRRGDTIARDNLGEWVDVNGNGRVCWAGNTAAMLCRCARAAVARSERTSTHARMLLSRDRKERKRKRKRQRKIERQRETERDRETHITAGDGQRRGMRAAVVDKKHVRPKRNLCIVVMNA